MSKRFQFGHKMQKKSWVSSKLDQEAEDRKIGFILLGVIVMLILIALFIW